MCRIFGYFDARTTPHELRAASALQRHGGPDAQTFATGPGWGLGSNRLAVTDPGGGVQPYRLGDGITVVFNGEIYNHAELRRRLAARGHQFEDDCDGSVLPALYAEYGPDFTDHLDGMYAVAVLDRRRDPTLLLATDDLGMKPLYYHWDAQRRELHFSSELPALLAFRAVPVEVWEPGLDAYLSTKTPFGEETMFRGIRVLPPAATAHLDRSRGLRIVRRDTAVVPAAPESPAGPGARVRSLLTAEVDRLVRADVPVALVTSGGLDSGLVSALAARRVPGLHSFNIAYTGTWPADERAFARETAEWNGTRHHQIEIDPARFPELLPDVVGHLGQPNADPITLSTRALFSAVREAGFTVALTGDGADEVFGGYDRMVTALRTPPGQDWVTRYVDALAAVPRRLRNELYSAEYRHFVAARGSAADRIAEELGASVGPRVRTLTEFESGVRMPAYHLRRVDHLSMAASVEVRLPFCQPSVQRHARALPEEAKVAARGGGKRALYAAAEGLLPPSVLQRPKQPFTLPVTAMLAPGQPLLEYVRELLAPGRLARSGRLDPHRVEQLFQEQLTRPNDRAALALWALAVHVLWLDRFFPATATADASATDPSVLTAQAAAPAPPAIRPPAAAALSALPGAAR
ncbi:asparagine synthase (glutamine-hydrolyzing) [Streptomyces sp. NPDC002055]|uniref:asparagine synthase (glutamine-hydrolyzing) n=1 Tax=Streptomyces sp. NPDC002055 TaxID=3154534 RepID=UPI00331F8E31